MKSYWSSTGKCLPCFKGFISNYFFTYTPTISNYNPFTCYQVQAGTDRWDNARQNCANIGTGVTTMIIRTPNENTDAINFYNLFSTTFWVRLVIINPCFIFSIYIFIKNKCRKNKLKANGEQLGYGTFTYAVNGGLPASSATFGGVATLFQLDNWNGNKQCFQQGKILYIWLLNSKNIVSN